MRILVVDDDPAVSGALQRALRLEGYEVTLAADGPRALEEVAVRPPDAVVLDIGLPGIDGIDVCRRMRAAADDTPVLILTARDAVEDRVEGLDAGETLSFSDLSLDPVTREAHRGDRTFTVTRIEFDLLELLLRHPRQVLTRELILDRVWGYTFDSGTNSLAVYVGYLRRKTEEDGEPRLIHTARGVGYVLREP